MGWWSSRVGSLALPSDAYQTDRKPFPVGKRSLASRRLRNHLPNLTISVMTNVSALPKSDIVNDADLARTAAVGDRARKPRFSDAAGIRLADNLDSLSRDEIDATQQHNLRATLTAARQSTDVWRRFPGLEGVDTVDDLAALPLLSGEDLAAGCPPHSSELLFDTRSPGLVLRSSGTASRPKFLYHSWDFTNRVGHLGVRGVRAALETPPNRVANCLFAGDLNGAFLFVQDITRSLPAFSFAMGEYPSPAEAAAIIEAHGIDTLAASPAYGAELLARGLDGHPLPP